MNKLQQMIETLAKRNTSSWQRADYDKAAIADKKGVMEVIEEMQAEIEVRRTAINDWWLANDKPRSRHDNNFDPMIDVLDEMAIVPLWQAYNNVGDLSTLECLYLASEFARRAPKSPGQRSWSREFKDKLWRECTEIAKRRVRRER